MLQRTVHSHHSSLHQCIARQSRSSHWHRSRQLSISSSCTDVTDRSMSPESELERGFGLPSRPDVRYQRVRRVTDAHIMVIILPIAGSSASATGQSQTPRTRQKVFFGAELQRLISRAPNFPPGTKVLPYRIIPLVGPNAVPQPRRLSTSSTTSQESS